MMKIPKTIQVPLLVAGVAALMVSTAAMTSGMEWTSAAQAAADARPPAAEPADSDAAIPAPRAKCAECGVVESVRRIGPAGVAPAHYEIAVRLRDGSIHLLQETSPAEWRPGERTILIAGRASTGQ